VLDIYGLGCTEEGTPDKGSSCNDQLSPMPIHKNQQTTTKLAKANNKFDPVNLNIDTHLAVVDKNREDRLDFGRRNGTHPSLRRRLGP
jgi:hypothetical protein